MSYIFLFLLTLLTINGLTQPLSSTQIDQLVEHTRTTFEVPGMAVAVIKNGKIAHLKGYGLRSLKNRLPVDQHTRFGIASNTKAFTTAALGILIEEGKLTWDDKLTKYIPEFQMQNPCVTQEFTIRDMLTHRSGLGEGAGDLMFFPGSSDFTQKDILRSFRYLKPVSSFRSKYDYDNLLYVVAGEVIERISGQSWSAFVEERIMKPLQMNQSAGSYERLVDKNNVIDPHASVNGTVQVIDRFRSSMGSSAGGIYASLADMSKWVLAQLSQGAYGNGERLFSPQIHAEMWTPQTIEPVGFPIDPAYNTHFAAYGLGWELSDMKGNLAVEHTGSLPGMRSQIVLLPELELGIIVLTNQQSSWARGAVVNSILDSYLNVPPTDRVSLNRYQQEKRQLQADSVTRAAEAQLTLLKQAGTSSLPRSAYLGTYRDNWFGEVVLSQQGETMWFRSVRSPRLRGEVFPYKNNTLLVKWSDRTLNADAYLVFTVDTNQQATAVHLKPISPFTDFSYDFQDLDLRRVR